MRPRVACSALGFCVALCPQSCVAACPQLSYALCRVLRAFVPSPLFPRVSPDLAVAAEQDLTTRQVSLPSACGHTSALTKVRGLASGWPHVFLECYWGRGSCH